MIKMNYSKLHEFIRKQKKKPRYCEFCKKNLPTQLAKVTEYYTKNIEDYRYLCIKCHRKFDKRHSSKQKSPSSLRSNNCLILLRKKSKRIDKLK